MKDGYIDFLNKFDIRENEFIEYGLNEIIFIENKIALKQWNELKHRIKNDKQTVLRNYGRQGKKNILFEELYFKAFNLVKIEWDGTNNAAPKKMIEEMTGLVRNINIYNYQISHVFGKTKNPYCFTAPWNIVYIPKIIDPLTGHESKGELTKKFRKRFEERVYMEYKVMIDEFNDIMNENKLKKQISEYNINLIDDERFDAKTKKRFFKDIEEQLSPINI